LRVHSGGHHDIAKHCLQKIEAMNARIENERAAVADGDHQLRAVKIATQIFDFLTHLLGSFGARGDAMPRHEIEDLRATNPQKASGLPLANAGFTEQLEDKSLFSFRRHRFWGPEEGDQLFGQLHAQRTSSHVTLSSPVLLRHQLPLSEMGRRPTKE